MIKSILIFNALLTAMGEILILFAKLNFVIFQISSHVTFLMYVTCQMCIGTIICQSEFCRIGEPHFFKTSLVIIYSTKIFDVYSNDCNVTFIKLP